MMELASAQVMTLAHRRSVNATTPPEIRLIAAIATTSAASATLTSSEETAVHARVAASARSISDVDTNRPTLTAEQRGVSEAISKAIATGSPRVFVLQGLAGTGKTTIAAGIAQRHKSAFLCAPTGRAAFNLALKTGLRATTIHKAIYRLVDAGKDDRGRERLLFERKLFDQELAGSVMLLDEASMVDTKMAEDILRAGFQVIAFGDPGQLPPVSGEQYFRSANATLHTIHRQALESPIIRQAHEVRAGRPYNADGPAFRVSTEVEEDDLLGADALLCWRNQTRHWLNTISRKLRGFTSPEPQAGEPILCFRNAARFRVFNGAIYTLLRPFREQDSTIVLDVDGKETEIPDIEFEGTTPKGRHKYPTSLFGFGYALTVHKAQGSEFDSVVLIDEIPARNQDRTCWLYTGITRAAERILVVTTEARR